MKVNLVRKAVTLGAAQTKNDEPHIAPLTDEITSISGKMFRSPARVFSDQNFRNEWEKAYVKVELGARTYDPCDTARAHLRCPSCKKRGRFSYSGLTFRDFRRSAVGKQADIGVQEQRRRIAS
jgi:hypothetical protein